MRDRMWRELKSATRAFIAAGNELLDSDEGVKVLREVLATGADSHIAVRLIGDRAATQPELVLELMPELFETALDINPYAARARFILAGLPAYLRNPRLEPLAAREIANPDPERWAELRGLAMLLELVGRMDLLESLKDAVRDSPSIELRDIAEDFPETPE